MRRVLVLAATSFFAVCALSACGSFDDSDSTASPASDHDAASDHKWDAGSEVTVTLSGSSASASDSSVKVSGSTVTITKAGNYRVRGTLTDGQLLVEATGDDLVRLILDGASITNADQAAFAVLEADKVVIILAENSRNSLTDGIKYTFPDPSSDEPNAALFSKTDLTIGGSGALTIKGNYNDGIGSKDGLVISSGTITVDAVDDGIRGKDYVVIKGGTITVKAGGDGLKADNDTDPSLGYVTISAGKVNVSAGSDPIDAETSESVAEGTFTTS